MSERDLRRRIPVKRRARPPHPSPSPSSHRLIAPAPRPASRPSRPVKVLKRCNSAPTLLTVGLDVGRDDQRNLMTPDIVLFRPLTCTDIFSPPELLSQSPQKFEGYKKDAKVVVNVTVEGSSGPIRTMVKLGSSVEETIRLVMTKYGEEGRSPELNKDAASTFELHNSYFSLQSLDKSELIGDVGSRSFYLRTSGNRKEMASGEIVSVKASTPSGPLPFLPAFISQKIIKIIRRTRKFWKIIGCMQCSG